MAEETPQLYASLIADAGKGLAVSNADLPAQVVAPNGKLTLYADFSATIDGMVPVYLVNRTNHVVPVQTQDGYPYLVREGKSADGDWSRVEGMYYSNCGNSYFRVVLEPGQHLRIGGAQSKEGAPSTVRYSCALLPGVVSNAGPGLVHPINVEAALKDDLARDTLPTIRELLHIEYFAIHPYRKIQVAPPRLVNATTGDPGAIVTAFDLLQHYQGSSVYQVALGAAAEEWKKSSDQRRVQAGDAVFQLLNLKAPPGPDAARLKARCLTILDSPGASPTSVAIVWRVLRELLAREVEARKYEGEPFN